MDKKRKKKKKKKKKKSQGQARGPSPSGIHSSASRVSTQDKFRSTDTFQTPITTGNGKALKIKLFRRKTTIPLGGGNGQERERGNQVKAELKRPMR